MPINIAQEGSKNSGRGIRSVSGETPEEQWGEDENTKGVCGLDSLSFPKGGKGGGKV